MSVSRTVRPLFHLKQSNETLSGTVGTIINGQANVIANALSMIGPSSIALMPHMLHAGMFLARLPGETAPTDRGFGRVVETDEPKGISGRLLGYAFILTSALSTCMTGAVPDGRIPESKEGSSDPMFHRILTRFFLYTSAVMFMLAFFTVYFGGFHYVNGIFLNNFFPLLDRSMDGMKR